MSVQSRLGPEQSGAQAISKQRRGQGIALLNPFVRMEYVGFPISGAKAEPAATSIKHGSKGRKLRAQSKETAEASPAQDGIVCIPNIKCDDYEVRVLMDANLNTLEDSFTAAHEAHGELMRRQIGSETIPGL
jgi:hypothetical protein